MSLLHHHAIFHVPCGCSNLGRATAHELLSESSRSALLQATLAYFMSILRHLHASELEFCEWNSEKLRAISFCKGLPG